VTERRNYVKYSFIKVDPAWRRRSGDERAADKREFAAACREFADDNYLRAYSLVGTRGDCDLMVRAISRTLVFLFEHYQTPDGGFAVPEVLQPYCGFDEVKSRS